MPTRPRTCNGKRYLTRKEWKEFLNNHWRHMNWKVNMILTGSSILIAIILAILAIVIRNAFAIGGL